MLLLPVVDLVVDFVVPPLPSNCNCLALSARNEAATAERGMAGSSHAKKTEDLGGMTNGWIPEPELLITKEEEWVVVAAAVVDVVIIIILLLAAPFWVISKESKL